MPALSMFFAILLFFGLIFTRHQQTLQANAVIGEAAAMSGNMRVYRNAVMHFARTHTFVTGSVADMALELPVWFHHRPEIQNYVAEGWGYVYFSAAQPELVSRLLESNTHSVLAGVNKSGRLYNPISGVTSMHLPVEIPEGSIVYAGG